MGVQTSFDALDEWIPAKSPSSNQNPDGLSGLNWKYMAGWSMLADGSALDCVKTLQKLQTNGFWFELEPTTKGCVEGGPDKLRCLFDQFLSVFLKEICASDSFRPLPPMLGDGQCVDLFKLFLVVKEKGGFDAVSKNGLWDSVAEESGLGSGVASAVKLIYIKYLDTLDRWLHIIFKDKDSKGGLPDSGDGADLGAFLMELETEFKGFLSEISDQKKKDEDYPHLDLDKRELNFMNVGMVCDDNGVADQKKKNEDYPHLDLDKSELNFLNVGLSSDSEEVRSSVVSDAGKECIDNDQDITILDSSVVKEEILNRKRKRGSQSGMLDWVAAIAKNPCDPVIGMLPERSKWKFYGAEQFWKQVLLAREALFLNRQLDSSAEQSIWQKKQKMHPSMYDVYIGSSHQFTERLRSSQRLLSVKTSKKSKSQACSESSSSGSQSDLDLCPSPFMAGMEDHLDKQLLGTTDPLTANSEVGLWWDNHIRKRIPVGPFFQAKVPEWTGEASESDSKWLGTQVWPLKIGEHRCLIERDRMGKGRQDSCGCQFPGSVECVRFHITEKRMRVKLELGSAFHRWKFDKMGEEVALYWTEEEEKKFKAIVKLNPPSLDKCFWDQMFKLFPNKSREDLVSYYFNVFLLWRRGYQNRCTPSNIDSDDDESEFGSSTNGFGHESAKSPGSIFRSPNKLHMNFR